MRDADPFWFEQDVLSENVVAFKDERDWVIKDVPDRLKGAMRLKTRMRYSLKEVSFQLNCKATVYFA